MLHKKHFSLSEAQSSLPEIKDQLAKIIKLKSSLDSQNYDIYKHQLFGGIGLNGSGKYPPEMTELIRLVALINETGIIIKDLDKGLIDFPHLRNNGEEVYLCYLYNENEIEFWHRIEDGFAGRKSISEL